MLRSLFISFVYLSFLGLGFQAPFVLSLGYVWVDAFRPQDVSYLILNQIPVAMIMGGCAVAFYMLMDRRDPPRLQLITVMQLALGAWITLTTFWAVLPDMAWDKWDWAFKTVVFSAFIPFVIRSRIQIEAFLQVYMLSLAANLVPFGAKVVISGGGYGHELGLTSGNTGLAEGSTLAAVAVMAIPIYLFLRQHSILAPKAFWFRSIYVGFAILSGLASLGTFERIGLVGFVILGMTMLLKSRRKILTLFIGLIAVLGAAYFVSDAWTARISTIGDYTNEGSALAQVLVWKWTLNFAMANPAGGGFGAFGLDYIEFPNGTSRSGVAFHSIYFEVLGEHGWLGLGLFVGLAVLSLWTLQAAARKVRPHAELVWCRDLITSIQIGLVVLLVCGAFIGIAFQPMIHYMFAMAVSISEYVRRAVVALPPSQEKPMPSWRNRPTPSQS